MAERAARWPFWRAWASSGLYVRIAPLPRLPSRQTFKHLFCVYDTEEEIKRPPGENEEEKNQEGFWGFVRQDDERNQVWDRFQDDSEQVACLGLGGEIQKSMVTSKEEREHPSGDTTG